MDPQMPPMPQPQPTAPDAMMGGEMSPMDGGNNMPPMDGEDPEMQDGGGMPPMDDAQAPEEENEFDSNFDAGVEADEDEDPQRYTQQLTGKLSQTLNKLVDENPNGAPSICKYVGKMILKQAVKGLDEKGRKELIGTLNNVSENPSEIEDDSDDETESMNECRFTKKEVNELAKSCMNDSSEDKRPASNAASLRKHPNHMPKHLTPKKFR